MEKLSVQDKVCLIVCLALMLMYSTAEQQYFTPNQTSTWNEARNHCQECFTDLVTMTHTNIRDIIQIVSSESWIGLRKNININSSSMAWSQWANGDPLIFQNWYPGYPNLGSSQSEKDCCSPTCPCLKMTTTTPVMTYNNTSPTYPTNTNVTSSIYAINTNVSSSIYAIKPNVTSSTYATNTDTNFTFTTNTYSTYATNPVTVSVEKECVAMLGFGAWIEKRCSDQLRFICYEDIYIGHVNVTNVTSDSVKFTWTRPPGNITNYRVQLQSDQQEPTEKYYDLDELMFGFDNLTDGTRYTVRVFPIRCNRDLKSQEATFYTKTFEVTNLTAINVTDTSVYLNWSKPNGKVDFYRINYLDKEEDTKTVGIQIDKLLPGHTYIFSVRSGVGPDAATLSEKTFITVYTKPGKVTNLQAFDNSETSLKLNWTQPTGNYNNFMVTAANDSNFNLFNKTVTNTNTTLVDELPVGTKIKLSVTALINLGGSILKGEEVSLVSYTIPEPISNLVLNATAGSISARWDPPVGNYTAFRVVLKLSKIIIETNITTTLEKKFDNLKSGANYTVIVESISGHLTSKTKQESQFTLPLPPTNPIVQAKNKTYVIFKWDSPDNSAAAHYFVSASSSFWNWQFNTTVNSNTTSCEIGPLKSGSDFTFQVQTMAGDLSAPLTTKFTTEADLRVITLSMMCSSQTPLLCDEDSTREDVFKQLNSHFYEELKDYVVWNLTKITGNTES